MLDDNELSRIETLDRYLTGELSKKDRALVEQRIQNDPQFAEELQALKLSQDAVRTQAWRERVASWHQKYAPQERDTEQRIAKHSTTLLPIWRYAGRVAAGLLIGVLGYLLIQYTTLTSETVYKENFVAYQLPVTRSQELDNSLIDSLYRAGDYIAVVDRFQAMSTPKVQDSFLASMSLLQLEQYEEAAQVLSGVLSTNQGNEVQFFQSEAEFYLALAWLGAENYREAERLFQRIKQDPQHTYNQNIGSSDVRKIRLLRWLK